jgi:hypothetical protein
MSKNMTRKGLAIGLGAVLVATSFGIAPATAAGLADKTFVSLEPTDGTEYTILAAANRTFSLTSNEAATVTTGNLKFLVSDPDEVIEPTIATSGREITIADNVTIAVTSGTDTVRVTAAHDLQIGDKFYWTTAFDGAEDNAGTNTEELAAADTIFTVSNINGTTWFEFVSTTDIADNDSDTTDGATTLRVVREARSALTKTFVVDTGSNSAATNSTLVLAVDGTNTRSVTVTAWKDANGNDKIDSTEYTSPERTVTWLKASSLVTSATMSPIAGDSKLTATVTTTPVLNGEQMLAADGDWLNVAFTRQDDTTVMYANDANSGDAVAVSVWDDDDKTWTVSVETDADAGTVGSSTVDGNTDAGWGDLFSPAVLEGGNDNTNEIEKIVVTAAGLVTVTSTAHGFRVGDKLNVVINAAAEDTKAASADEDGVVITSVPSSTTFTYKVSAASPTAGTADSAVAALNAGTTITPVTWAAGKSIVDRVFAGTYTAQVYVAGVANGSKLSVGTASATAASASITSVASASVTGKTVTTDTANDVTVKTGTTSVSFTLTALDADKAAVSAGRAVVVSTEAPVDGGAASGTFKINGLSSAVLYTDAAGTVTFTLTATDTRNSAQTRVSAVVENLVTVGMDVHWDDQAYTLVDFGTTAGTIATDAAMARTTTRSGTYTLDLAVADQWFQAAPAASYRIVVSGSGVTEKIHDLVNGRASVAVKDAGIVSVGSTFTSTIAVQKLTGSTWGATSTHTLTTTIAATPSVKLGADGSSLYQPAGSTAVVDLSDKVAEKALVEIDKRSSTTATPAYANDLILQGLVANATTSAAVANSYVTISGPTSILFSNGEKAARGSLTFLSDSNGEFEVYLYSTSSQTDTVITVTSMGGSATTKVTFTGIGVGEGTKLDVTTPATVDPASTFQVKAKLTDAYGNAVEATTGRMKVTYTGPGIVFGTLPDKTDKNGELSFSVLLGSNDKNAITVVVSYDQNGDGDFVDTKDLNTTKTINVGATAEVTAVIGSFNGRVAVRVENAKGSTVSVKIGKSWYKYSAISNNYLQSWKSRKGASVAVSVYVDGELQNVQTITVK